MKGDQADGAVGKKCLKKPPPHVSVDLSRSFIEFIFKQESQIAFRQDTAKPPIWIFFLSCILQFCIDCWKQAPALNSDKALYCAWEGGESDHHSLSMTLHSAAD